MELYVIGVMKSQNVIAGKRGNPRGQFHSDGNRLFVRSNY